MKPADLPGWPQAMGVPLAAAYIGVSERTLWQLAHDGTIPTFALGNRRLIDRDELDRWIKAEAERQQPKRRVR